MNCVTKLEGHCGHFHVCQPSLTSVGVRVRDRDRDRDRVRVRLGLGLGLGLGLLGPHLVDVLVPLIRRVDDVPVQTLGEGTRRTRGADEEDAARLARVDGPLRLGVALLEPRAHARDLVVRLVSGDIGEI